LLFHYCFQYSALRNIIYFYSFIICSKYQIIVIIKFMKNKILTDINISRTCINQFWFLEIPMSYMSILMTTHKLFCFWIYIYFLNAVRFISQWRNHSAWFKIKGFNVRVLRTRCYIMVSWLSIWYFDIHYWFGMTFQCLNTILLSCVP